MDQIQPGEQPVVTPTTPETPIIVPPQTPIEQELEKEKGKQPRSEAEKAAFALQKNAERATELGLDPATVLGIKPQVTPAAAPAGTVVTVEMLDARERERGQKTALQLADEIADPHEREQTKTYLQNRIVPSGDPYEDLRFARLAVNSVKSGQIVEELARGGRPATHAAAPGAPAPVAPKEPELTAEELAFMRPPFNLSKEQILSKRPK